MKTASFVSHVVFRTLICINNVITQQQIQDTKMCTIWLGRFMGMFVFVFWKSNCLLSPDHYHTFSHFSLAGWHESELKSVGIFVLNFIIAPSRLKSFQPCTPTWWPWQMCPDWLQLYPLEGSAAFGQPPACVKPFAVDPKATNTSHCWVSSTICCPSVKFRWVWLLIFRNRKRNTHR